MSFTFTEKPNAADENPNQRFPQPAPNMNFDWWANAVPQPAYRLCVVRIDSVNQSTIQCTPLDINGVAKAQLTLDLDNWTQAWRKDPSTIDRPALPTLTLATNHALLCIAEHVLASNGWTTTEITAYSKWPRGEDLVDNP